MILSEYTTYTPPAGPEYQLHAPGVRTLFSPEGTGMPPIEYLTQRGPNQHGETLRGYHLRPRIIQVLIRSNSCSRDDYWRARKGILDALRPNSQPLNQLNTGVLKTVLSTGDIRAINCLIQEGPAFAPQPREVWDEWSFTDTLRFIAFDPIYYNPTQQSCIFDYAAQSQLVFPITFPITFSQTVASGSCTALTYVGSWSEYPTIIIAGPITGPRIENASIGESIGLDYTIPAGRSVTITLTYGSKIIELDDGTNLMGFVTQDSNLGTFRLETDPTVSSGINSINVYGSAIDTNTSWQIQWYNRYIGLGA